LIEIDPGTGEVRRTLTLDLQPTALAVGKEAIWVADYDAQTVAEIDPGSGQTVATIAVGKGPSALAVVDGAVWVANALDSTVSRIDPVRGSVVATIPVGSGPTALAVTPGSVWVANQYSSTVSQIDTRRNIVVRTRPAGGEPTALATNEGKLWIGVRPLVQQRGGTLRLLHTRPLSIDPALQSDLPPLQADGLTRDGLVSYNHVSGPAGVQLVPDLALSLPTPTDRGTTYTFRLRLAIRYSDGRPVRASDFRRAIERVFNLRSYGTDLLGGIRGAEACLRLDATDCDLAPGIVTNDARRTVTFHLNAPDRDFLAKLTNGGLATPVPPGTPAHDAVSRPIPGTGPYKIAVANRLEIVYIRNQYFHEWSHAAQPDGKPDEIVWRFGLSPTDEVRTIEQGRADWMADAVPGTLLAGLATRFASQLHTFPTTETDFFQLDTTRPPFDDVRVRQALNLAIDRRAIVRIYGGATAASPTCQVLPPGVAGYRRYCPYTRKPNAEGVWSGPDFARAQRLVLASGTRGDHVTVWGWTDDPTISPRVIAYTAAVLRRLGYRTRVRLMRHADFDRLPARVRRTVQLIPAGWLDITAYNFISSWLSCNGAIDHGKFCDPALDRRMHRAHALEVANPRAAASVWAQVDRELVDRAAWVPLVNPRQIDFVSARIKNFQHHPYWDIMADQLSLK
jgi:YVTN family beta-propeller protein